MSKCRGKGIKYIPVTEVHDGISYEMEPDRDAYLDIEKNIKKLQQVSSKTRKKEYSEMVRKELNKLREERKETTCGEAVNLELSLGKNKKVITLNGKRPTLIELKTHFKEFRTSLSKGRVEKRVQKPENKQYMGMAYQQVGGVFSAPGSILSLMGKKDRRARIRNHKAPHPKIKDNYFGLELELISAANKEDLEALFIEEKLDANIHIRGDGSINGVKQGYYSNEVTVLVKESDLEDVIGRVCAVLKKTKSYVNDSCGGHVHVDVRKRSVETVYKNMRYALPLMSKIVTIDRVSNRYCGTDIEETFNVAASRGDRYKAVNASSFSKYKTIEIRYGNASIHAEDLVMWCKLLSVIADAEISSAITSGDDLTIKNAKLAQWVDERTKLMATKQLTTTQLHALRA